MNLYDIITAAITNKLGEFRIYTEIAKVVSVDEDNMSAEVEFINSDSNKTVRLGATISENNTAGGISSVVILPVVGSFVLVTFINATTGFISSVTDVSKVLLKVEDRFIQLDSDFIQLSGDADNAVRFSPLDSNLQNLVTAIQTELGKIATGIAGAGGSYTPGTLNLDLSGAKIEEIKTL